MSSCSIVVLILLHFSGCKLFEHQEHSGFDMLEMVKGKMPEEIRKMFNIKNDFAPKEDVLRDNVELNAVYVVYFVVICWAE